MMEGEKGGGGGRHAPRAHCACAYPRGARALAFRVQPQDFARMGGEKKRRRHPLSPQRCCQSLRRARRRPAGRGAGGGLDGAYAALRASRAVEAAGGERKRRHGRLARRREARALAARRGRRSRWPRRRRGVRWDGAGMRAATTAARAGTSCAPPARALHCTEVPTPVACLRCLGPAADHCADNTSAGSSVWLGHSLCVFSRACCHGGASIGRVRVGNEALRGTRHVARVRSAHTGRLGST